MPASAEAAAAVRGVEWLLAARDAEGWWRAFNPERIGPSDEWVTAYVGTSLALLPHQAAREAAREAWLLLLDRQSAQGGWCMNRRFGVGDADSTTWAIQLARAIGEQESEAAERAARFLERHIRPDGGIATFVDYNPAGVGWMASHACVTAAVGALPDLLPRVRWYLWRSQARDGSWRSYWWTGREYATALACEALAAGGLDVDRAAVDRAVAWTLARLGDSDHLATDAHPDGSAFATAWCLRTVFLSPQEEARAAALRTARWLLGAQRPDGSWRASGDMRVPRIQVLDPDATARARRADLVRPRSRGCGRLHHDDGPRGPATMWNGLRPLSFDQLTPITWRGWCGTQRSAPFHSVDRAGSGSQPGRAVAG